MDGRTARRFSSVVPIPTILLLLAAISPAAAQETDEPDEDQGESPAVEVASGTGNTSMTVVGELIGPEQDAPLPARPREVIDHAW